MRVRDDIRRVQVKDLVHAPEYNRDIDERWVRKIIADLVEVPPAVEVSDRGDSLVIIDGQHRCEAVSRKWGPTATVIAHVHHGLSVSEEAALFYRLNQRRNLRPYHAFHSLVIANAPEAIDILKVLDTFGLTYGQSPSANVVAAVDKLRKIYADQGIHGLSATIGLLVSAWGHDGHAWDGVLLAGTALFLDHYQDADLRRVRGRLASYEGGPVAFLRDAKGIAHTLKTSGPRGVVWLIVDVYNRRAGRGTTLPPWQ